MDLWLKSNNAYNLEHMECLAAIVAALYCGFFLQEGHESWSECVERWMELNPAQSWKKIC